MYITLAISYVSLVVPGHVGLLCNLKQMLHVREDVFARVAFSACVRLVGGGEMPVFVSHGKYHALKIGLGADFAGQSVHVLGRPLPTGAQCERFFDSPAATSDLEMSARAAAVGKSRQSNGCLKARKAASRTALRRSRRWWVRKNSSSLYSCMALVATRLSLSSI